MGFESWYFYTGNTTIALELTVWFKTVTQHVVLQVPDNE